MIEKLYSKDTKEGYKELLLIESDSLESNKYYKYMDEFIKMLSSDISYIRVRGFRLICFQSKWDINNIINNNINRILDELDDEKPTSVRQCLKSLRYLLLYKTELNDVIMKKLNKINYMKYKDSMSGLIKNDIEDIIGS